MKKVLALAVGMLLIPFTAFGMQIMDDAAMDSITGQSGVALSLSNIQIYNDASGDELWYETYSFVEGDSNNGDAQAVGIVSAEGSSSFLFINAVAAPEMLLEGGDGLWNTLLVDTNDEIATRGNALLRGNYEPLKELNEGPDGTETNLEDLGMRQQAAVLSIRVVDESNSVFIGKTTQADFSANEFAAVEIGLPTLELYSVAGSQDVMQIFVVGADVYGDSPVGVFGAFDPNNPSTTFNNYKYSIGTLYTTDAGSTTTILGGRIGITSFGQIDTPYVVYGQEQVSVAYPGN